ncbi:MAG: hypothetical protein WC619_05855 [Patescibacteria group bacterium]
MGEGRCFKIFLVILVYQSSLSRDERAGEGREGEGGGFRPEVDKPAGILFAKTIIVYNPLFFKIPLFSSCHYPFRNRQKIFEWP